MCLWDGENRNLFIQSREITHLADDKQQRTVYNLAEHRGDGCALYAERREAEFSVNQNIIKNHIDGKTCKRCCHREFYIARTAHNGA